MNGSLLQARPLWLKQLGWKLTGKSGRSIVWRINLLRLRYALGVGLAKRLCRGNRYGDHTSESIQPLGGECFCDRVRGRLDFIPF